MKFSVSILSDKGTKKEILSIIADRFEEEEEARGRSYGVRLRFFAVDKSFFWGTAETLIASVLLDSLYVVEQVAA